MKFMSDNGIIFDKMEDCQAFEANPNFVMYDIDGHITNECDAAMLLEIKDRDGYYFCHQLMVKQNSPEDGLENEPGYYFWNLGKFHYLDEGTFKLIRSIRK